VRKSKKEIALEDALWTLYRLEINCGLSSFWDGGWAAWVGDDMNGRRAETDGHLDLSALALWLLEAAAAIYPTAPLDAYRRKPSLFRWSDARNTGRRPILIPVAGHADTP
jgi:hypothetical protein